MTLPAAEEARIRATVARHYRMQRRFQPMASAVVTERNGWAEMVAHEVLNYGTPNPTSVLYYKVACEYVEAAQRLAQRRAGRRLVRSS